MSEIQEDMDLVPESAPVPSRLLEVAGIETDEDWDALGPPETPCNPD